MQAKSRLAATLGGRLMRALAPLFKGSQAEVMAVTADLDLTLSQIRILFELDHNEEALAVSELAERISLSMAAAGRAIDALYRLGLVARREDDNDRRVKRISLTGLAHETIAKVVEVRQQTAERFVAALSADEYAALESAVATIAALTAAHLPPAAGATGSRAQEPANE